MVKPAADVSSSLFDEEKRFRRNVAQQSTPVYASDRTDVYQQMLYGLRRAMQTASGDGAVGDGFLVSAKGTPLDYDFDLGGGFDSVGGPDTIWVRGLHGILFTAADFRTDTRVTPQVVSTSDCRLTDSSVPSGWFGWLDTDTAPMNLIPDVDAPGVFYPIVSEGNNYVEVSSAVDLDLVTSKYKHYRIVPDVPGSARTDLVILDVWLNEVGEDEDANLDHGQVIAGAGEGDRRLRLMQNVWVVPDTTAKSLADDGSDFQTVIEGLFGQPTDLNRIVDADGNRHYYLVLATVTWDGAAVNLGDVGTTITDRRPQVLRLADVQNDFLKLTGGTMTGDIVFSGGAVITGSGVVGYTVLADEAVGQRHMKVQGHGADVDDHLFGDNGTHLADPRDTTSHDNRYFRKSALFQKLGGNMFVGASFNLYSAALETTLAPALATWDPLRRLVGWSEDIPKPHSSGPATAGSQRTPYWSGIITPPSVVEQSTENAAVDLLEDQRRILVQGDGCCETLVTGVVKGTSVCEVIPVAQEVSVCDGGFMYFAVDVEVGAGLLDQQVRPILRAKERVSGVLQTRRKVNLYASDGTLALMGDVVGAAEDEVVIADNYLRDYLLNTDPRGIRWLELDKYPVKVGTVRVYIDDDGAGAGAEAEWTCVPGFRERPTSIVAAEEVFAVKTDCDGKTWIGFSPNYTIYANKAAVESVFGAGSFEGDEAGFLFDRGEGGVFIDVDGRVCAAENSASAADLWGAQPAAGANIRVEYSYYAPVKDRVEALWEMQPDVDTVDVELGFEVVSLDSEDADRGYMCPAATDICVKFSEPSIRKFADDKTGSSVTSNVFTGAGGARDAQDGQAARLEHLGANAPQVARLRPHPVVTGATADFEAVLDLDPALEEVRVIRDAWTANTDTDAVHSARKGATADAAVTITGPEVTHTVTSDYGYSSIAHMGIFTATTNGGFNGLPLRTTNGGTVVAQVALFPDYHMVRFSVEFGGFGNPAVAKDFTAGTDFGFSCAFPTVGDLPNTTMVRVQMTDSRLRKSAYARAAIVKTAATGTTLAKVYALLTSFQGAEDAGFSLSDVVSVTMDFFHMGDGNARDSRAVVNNRTKLDITDVGVYSSGAAVDVEDFTSYSDTTALRTKTFTQVLRSVYDLGRFTGKRQLENRTPTVVFPREQVKRIRYFGDTYDGDESTALMLVKGTDANQAGGSLGTEFGQDVRYGRMLFQDVPDPGCRRVFTEVMHLKKGACEALPCLTAEHVYTGTDPDCPAISVEQGMGAMIPARLSMAMPDDSFGTSPGLAYGDMSLTRICIPTFNSVPAAAAAHDANWDNYMTVVDGAFEMTVGTNYEVTNGGDTRATVYHFGGGRTAPTLPLKGGGEAIPAASSEQPVYMRHYHGPGLEDSRNTQLTSNITLNAAADSITVSTGSLTGKEFYVGQHVWLHHGKDPLGTKSLAKAPDSRACWINEQRRESVWYDDLDNLVTAGVSNLDSTISDSARGRTIGLYGIITAIPTSATMTIHFDEAAVADADFFTELEAAVMASPPGAQGCYVEFSRGFIENCEWARSGVDCADLFSCPNNSYIDVSVAQGTFQAQGMTNPQSISSDSAAPDNYFAYKDPGGLIVYSKDFTKWSWNRTNGRIDNEHGFPLLLDPDDVGTCVFVPDTAVCVSITPEGELSYLTEKDGTPVVVGVVQNSIFGAIPSVITANTGTYTVDNETADYVVDDAGLLATNGAPGADWPAHGFISTAAVQLDTNFISHPSAGIIESYLVESRALPCDAGSADAATVIADGDGETRTFVLPDDVSKVIDASDWSGVGYQSPLLEITLGADAMPGDTSLTLHGAYKLIEGDALLVIDDTCPEGFLTWLVTTPTTGVFDSSFLLNAATTVPIGRAVPDPANNPSDLVLGCPAFTGFECVNNARVILIPAALRPTLKVSKCHIEEPRYREPFNEDPNQEYPATLWGYHEAPVCASEAVLHQPNTRDLADEFQVALDPATLPTGWLEFIGSVQPYRVAAPDPSGSQAVQVFRLQGVSKHGVATELSEGAAIDDGS